MKTNNFVVVTLGGVGIIGMNVTLYHYNGKWIVVDLGIGFAGESNDMPGVDMLVPDISFIVQKKDDIIGLFLTHAHEDHYGAIQYLWRELGCPIYATNFTAKLLMSKLSGMQIANEIPLHIIEPGKLMDFDPFQIKYIHMTHSIPESNSLLIKTEKGVAIHTGDWKIDETPMLGETSDIESLKLAGEEGVDVVICDSTNSLSKGRTKSEREAFVGLDEIIGNAEGAVAVTLFASNVERTQSIFTIAKKRNRKIALLGYSLVRSTNVAKESGYLEGCEFIDINDAKNYPRSEILILCTGCQGESGAAISQLAMNTHGKFSLQKGDMVVFSSRIIPGNDVKIYKVLNEFAKRSIEVVTDFMTDQTIHVTGHPAQGDLRLMYEMTKPKLSIPVHGEYLHLTAHAKFARELGVEHVIVPSPGSVIDLIERKVLGEVKAGYFGVDGNYLHHQEGEVIQTRKRIGVSGLVIITLIMKNGKLVKSPTVFSPGAFDSSETDLTKMISDRVAKIISSAGRSGLYGAIRTGVLDLLQSELNKRPMIEIQIIKI